MLDTIPATKAKNNFGELIKRVFTSGESVIVAKDGIPVVTISPVARADLHTPVKRNETDPAPASHDVAENQRSETDLHK